MDSELLQLKRVVAQLCAVIRALYPNYDSLMCQRPQILDVLYITFVNSELRGEKNMHFLEKYQTFWSKY